MRTRRRQTRRLDPHRRPAGPATSAPRRGPSHQSPPLPTPTVARLSRRPQRWTTSTSSHSPGQLCGSHPERTASRSSGPRPNPTPSNPTAGRPSKCTPRSKQRKPSLPSFALSQRTTGFQPRLCGAPLHLSAHVTSCEPVSRHSAPELPGHSCAGVETVAHVAVGRWPLRHSAWVSAREPG